MDKVDHPTPPSTGKRWHRALLGVLVLVVAAYSAHVIIHDPEAHETIVAGQANWPAGGQIALRVIVRNGASARKGLELEAIPGAEVKLSLRDKAGRAANLGSYTTNARGTIDDLAITVPDWSPGDCELTVETRSHLGEDRIQQSVHIESFARVVVATDKPTYQPGQTIHLRAYAFRVATRRPVPDASFVFEVFDAKGNKVFKEQRAGSAFGIASADFALASELNEGDYRISVAVAGATTERAVNVSRYVLPKFKTTLTTEKSCYQPGETLRGRIHAGYVFGQPVEGADVRIVAQSFIGPGGELGRATGRTGADGSMTFELTLPATVPTDARKPTLAATITDSAGQQFQTTIPLRLQEVNTGDVRLTLAPECGTIVLGVENVAFVIAQNADGTPASGEFELYHQTLKLDENGIGILRLPACKNVIRCGGDVRFHGRSIRLEPFCHSRPGVLLRPDHSVYRSGDTVRVTLMSSEDHMVFLDVWHDGRCILNRSAQLHNQRAEITFTLPAGLAGLVELSGYYLQMAAVSKEEEARWEEPYQWYDWPGWRGSASTFRRIFVTSPPDLRIAARPVKPVFRPGEEASLDLKVVNADGRGVPAALGLSVVDESVFANREDTVGVVQEILAPRRKLFAEATQRDWLSDKITPFPLSLLSSPAELLARGDSRFVEAFLAAGVAQKTYRENDGDRAFPLHAATGLVKYIEAKLWREDYFITLGLVLVYIGIVFGTARFFHWASHPRHIEERLEMTEEVRQSIRAVIRQHLMFVALTFLPAVLYLAAGLLSMHWQVHDETLLWCAVAIEAALMMGCPVWLWIRTPPCAGNLPELSKALRRMLPVFPVQFLLARGLMIAVVTDVIPRSMWDVLHYSPFVLLGCFFFLISLPCVVTAISAACCQRVIARHGMSHRLIRLPFPEAGLLLSLAVAVVVWATNINQPEQSQLLALLLLLTLASAGAIVFFAWRSERALNAPLPPEKPPRPLLRFVLMYLLPVLAIISLRVWFVQIQMQHARERQVAYSIIADPTAFTARDVVATMGTRTFYHPSNVQPPAAPRVRHHFPETLVWQPHVITDDSGRAQVNFALADSITTWRASLDAISASGGLGMTNLPLRAFQEFFVDLNLPVSLAVNDRVSVPAVCFNYLDQPQTVTVTLERAAWFEADEASRTQSVTIGPRAVRSLHFPIRATRAGEHRLRVTARGGQSADAIERPVQVRSTFPEVARTENAILRDRLAFNLDVPADAVPGSAKLLVKLHPSRFSEIVEGFESIFQMPHGCFEQTSACTYPSALALAYLKRTGRLDPTIEKRARRWLSDGYQRLLTFEVPGGGFDWYGKAPANIALSAYGVLEFTDIARVHPIDPAVIERTTKWLLAQQKPDGHWSAAGNHGWQAGDLETTAYVAWALAEAGDRSAQLRSALGYLCARLRGLVSPYAQALAANALLAIDPKDSTGHEVVQALLKNAKSGTKDTLSWPAASSDARSITGSAGRGLEEETTALAAMALIKAGGETAALHSALRWLSAAKSGHGYWTSTQSTVLSIRALLQGTDPSARPDGTACSITVLLNGEPVETLAIKPESRDLLRVVDLTSRLMPGANRIEVRQEPTGEIGCQITGSYSSPSAPAQPQGTLGISAAFDRFETKVHQPIRATVTVTHRGAYDLAMAIVDIGVPAGFEPDLDGLRARRDIARVERAGDRVHIYLERLAADTSKELSCPLIPRTAAKVTMPPAVVYEYYHPANRAETKPVSLIAE
ncbi:MAG: hypothetical protein HZA88_03855 [Verrucomicrobia bacterium]|nr:hypothetical protein [Verrucomicrobiota bacterium]